MFAILYIWQCLPARLCVLAPSKWDIYKHCETYIWELSSYLSFFSFKIVKSVTLSPINLWQDGHVECEKWRRWGNNRGKCCAITSESEHWFGNSCVKYDILYQTKAGQLAGKITKSTWNLSPHKMMWSQTLAVVCPRDWGPPGPRSCAHQQCGP